MSRFMKSLTDAVANHVTENNICIYANNKVVYDKNEFRQSLARCTGESFIQMDIDDFVNNKTTILRLVENISYNSDRSFNDLVYLITCIANASLLKNECELNSFENSH